MTPQQEYNARLLEEVTAGLDHLSMAWQDRMSSRELGAIGVTIEALRRAAAEDQP